MSTSRTADVALTVADLSTLRHALDAKIDQASRLANSTDDHVLSAFVKNDVTRMLALKAKLVRAAASVE